MYIMYNVSWQMQNYYKGHSSHKVKSRARYMTVIQNQSLLQTGLGDPSSDVPSSSTSVLVLMGTVLPNVFLLLCSVIPMSASVIKFRGERVKSMNKCPIVPSRCPLQSSNLGDEKIKSMHDVSVSLFCHGQSR